MTKNKYLAANLKKLQTHAAGNGHLLNFFVPHNHKVVRAIEVTVKKKAALQNHSEGEEENSGYSSYGKQDILNF